MKCMVCNVPEDQAELIEGVYGGDIVTVCRKCADLESIPIIKKPTQEQLLSADQRFTVRERMEKLSPQHKLVSKEQKVARRNLTKLNLPEQKQYPEDLVENYDWVMKMARRRTKMTLSQLSQSTHIPEETLDKIERATPPENYKEILHLIESALSIKLFKEHAKEIHYLIPENKKEKIINEVREKIEHLKNIKEEPKLNLKTEQEKTTLMNKVAKGEIDFSKRENIKTITLSDLVDARKQREKKEFLGDDLELED